MTAAYQFPVPKRDFGSGVQLAFATMTALVNAHDAVLYDGGYVLRGSSTILWPRRWTTTWDGETKTVRWNAVRADPSQQGNAQDAPGIVPANITVREVNEVSDAWTPSRASNDEAALLQEIEDERLKITDLDEFKSLAQHTAILW